MPPRPFLMLAALLLGAMASAMAQPSGRRPAAAPPPGPAAPPAPAQAPPPPALLAPPTAATGPARPAEPPLSLPPGMQALPQGGWRVRFTDESASLLDNPAVQAALADIGRRLEARQGRVSLAAQASGPVRDISAARRLTLTRALAVKQALAAGGLAESRIDVRALGRTAEAEDAVDVLPPEAQSAARPSR